MPINSICMQKINSMSTFNIPKIFIETGFKEGETTNIIMNSNLFTQIYSIELHKEYLDKKREKFNNTNVQLICGDSGTEMSKLLDTLNEPCMFFLDAHGHSFNDYINQEKTTCSPLYRELEAIKKFKYRKESIIMIDDYFYIFNSKPRTNENNDVWYDCLTDNGVTRYISEIYGEDFTSFKSNYGNVPYGKNGKNYIMMFYK